MAFIAIDAKADVANSKKGKLTPAQHAQLNAWCLANKTGILDWGEKCESTAQSYSVSSGTATVVFQKGYIVICGRLVECEANSQVVVTAPTSGSITGKIILRYNLSSTGEQEFVATTTTANFLTQQDLNDNPLTGVYEFELYSYTATASIVTLTRNTEYVPDIGGKLEQFITKLTGTGVIGSGNPPLQGYDKSKGTIETRLTNLGFRYALISLIGGSGGTRHTVYRQGNIVYAHFTSTFTFTQSIAQNYFASNAQQPIFTLTPLYKPKTDMTIYFSVIADEFIGATYEFTINHNTGEVKRGSLVAQSTQAFVNQTVTLYVSFGFEALPIN